MAEEFEQIDALAEGEENEVMNTSDYAQVIFHDIAESYPVDCNINCKYTVTCLLQATKRDWVGLYKVGWTSSKDHIYYEWAKLPESLSEGKSYESQITFKASTLPGDDGEFYQFCYVTTSGQVRGASTPFQFKRPSAEQYVEVEDLDDDIMVIKSKTSALEDELGHVRKERETLVKGRERLENERESLLRKLMASEKKINSEKQQREILLKDIKSKEAKVDSLQSEARDMGLVSDSLRGKINKLSEEKMTLSRKLDEKDSYTRSLQEKVKSLINEKDSLMGKNRMLEEEKDLYKTHFSSSENTLQGHLKEIDDLQKQLRLEEDTCVDLRGQISTLGQELELTINKLNSQERAAQQDKELVEMLKEQLRCNQEKIEALEECKAAIGAELDTVTLAMTDFSEKWERSQSEAHRTKEQLKLLEQVHENQTVTTGEQIQELNMRLKQKNEDYERLLVENGKMKAQVAELAEKSNKPDEAPLVIMKMAHHQLTGRLNRVEQEKDELQKTVDELTKKKDSWEMSSHDMAREVEDLRERLAMGQDEYRDKSVECQRIRKELRKMHKHGCSCVEMSTSGQVVKKRASRTSSRKSSETRDSQSDSFTQTQQSTGDKTTETDRKIAAEQMTQTKVKVEKENHTQTSTLGRESETQTKVKVEKENQTQTSVLGRESETQTKVKVEKENHTQTSVLGREGETQTKVKKEKESETQTRMKEEKENHTQTSVMEKESETQTSVHEKEIETQTSVLEMENSGNDAGNLADLTNPELLCQLDDLGKELATRNARKQKYKEMYQKEREKCAYLQRHYYEELEKKDQEIERIQEHVRYLETCLSEMHTGNKREFQDNTEAHTTSVYPPQLPQCRVVSPPIPTPIVSQPVSTLSPPMPPSIHCNKPPVLKSNEGQIPPKIPPRAKKPENKGVSIKLPKNQQQWLPPTFPPFYDHKPIIPHHHQDDSHIQQRGSGVPTEVTEPHTQESSAKATPPEVTLNLKELDPLTTTPSAQPTAPEAQQNQDHPALLQPLQPEVLPTARVAQVLKAVGGHSAKEEPQFMDPTWNNEEMGQMLDIKVPPVHENKAGSGQSTAVSVGTVARETGENRGGDLGQASGGNVDQEPEEQEEERFFDARDNNKEMKQCPVCDMTFDLTQFHEAHFLQHVEEHFTNTKDCPMCGKKFSSNTDNQVYENHVNRHFERQDEDNSEDEDGFTEV